MTRSTQDAALAAYREWTGQSGQFEPFEAGYRAALDASAEISVPGNDAGMREALKALVEHIHASRYRCDRTGLRLDANKAVFDQAERALSPPTGSAGGDETGVREDVRAHVHGTPNGRGSFFNARTWSWQDTPPAALAPQPPKAETPAEGVDDWHQEASAREMGLDSELDEERQESARLALLVVEGERALRMARVSVANSVESYRPWVEKFDDRVNPWQGTLDAVDVVLADVSRLRESRRG